MAGRRVELFAKRTFDMTGVLAAETMTVELIDRLDVRDAERATLLVRTHSADFSGGGSIAVVIQQTAPSAEDPSVDFIGSDLVSTTAGSSAPSLAVAGVDLLSITTVRVVVDCTQSGGGGSLTGELSAELVLEMDDG